MAKFKNKDIAISKKFVPRFWESADGRSVIVKQIQRRINRLIEHTGADSEQKQILVQRSVFLLLQIETSELRLVVDGVPLDGTHTQMVNTLQGLLNKLGLDLADVQQTLDLKAYVARANR